MEENSDSILSDPSLLRIYLAMLLQVQNCIDLQKLTSFANVWVASGLLKYCPTYIVVEV